MRKGQSPVKSMGIPAYPPRRLGVGIGLYVPFLEGYYEQALSIFRYQMASLLASGGEKFDLLVLDNGSCPEVRAELMRSFDRGEFDWLTLSPHNLGRNGAINYVLGSMPNELICYTDCDVLFRPGWVEATLEIFDSFPLAGLVAAQPPFFDVLEGGGKAHLAVSDDPGFEVKEFIAPEVDFEEYCRGIGAPPEQVERLRKARFSLATNRTTGVSAVLYGTHMTFTMPRRVALQILPLPFETGLAPEEARHLDWRIDNLGLLHLATTTSFVAHMGNALDEKFLREVEVYRGSAEQVPGRDAPHSSSYRQWVRRLAFVARRRPLRGLLRRAYRLLFDVYAEQRRGGSSSGTTSRG